MTTADTTCEYTVDPDNPETWGGSSGSRCYVDTNALNDDGVWDCPHDAVDGETLCPFHRPVEQKADGAALDALVESLSSSDGAGEQSLRCFGARFSHFDLGERDGIPADSIELAHATVAGSCDWSGIDVDVNYLDLSGLSVGGDANFRETTFEGYTAFVGAHFKQDASFDDIRFVGHVDFRSTIFGRRNSFVDATFDSDAIFASVRFFDDGNFEGATFGDTVRFNRAMFRKAVDFTSARFEGPAEFVSMRVKGDSIFDDAAFESSTDFSFAEVGDVDSSGIL